MVLYKGLDAGAARHRSAHEHLGEAYLVQGDLINRNAPSMPSRLIANPGLRNGSR